MPSTTITTSEKEISLSLTPTITGYHIQGDLSPDEMRDSGTDETPDIVAGVPTFLKTQDFTAQLDFDNNANFLSPTTVTTEFKVDSGAGYGRGRDGGRGAGGYGRNSRGGGRFGRDRPPREMHKTECADCGNECEVPFKPNGEKPVYCNDCFQDHKPARDDRGRGRY